MSITDTITETMTSIPEWSLSTLKSSNDAVLSATKKLVDVMAPVTSRIPASPLADRLPSLPQPTELLSQWFGYAEKFVAEQKRFGLDLAGAVVPAPVVEPAPTRKSTASKAA